MTTPVIVSDMDGTLTTAETWRGVLAWIRANHPSAAARRFVPLRVPVVLAMRAGLIAREPFRDRWLLDQARLLRGLPAAAAAEMGEWVVETSLWPARCEPAIAALGAAVADARAVDPAARLILASASYQPIVEAFGRRVQADLVLGTPLEFRDGRATGALTAPVQSGQHKAAAVRSATSGQDVLVAFGDSGADVALLELARRAVAVAPDAALRRVADQRGWEILEASA